MIYCLNCGKGIPNESKFCTFCGTHVPTINPTNPDVAETFSSVEQTPIIIQQTPPPIVQQTPPPVVQQTPPAAVTQNYSTVAPQNFAAVPPQYATVNTTNNITTVTRNEFYKNIGFWGAVIAFIGFFLPYTNGNDASFYYLVSDIASTKPELYIYLVFPVSAAILIIQGLTGLLPKFLVVIFKILPLLMLFLFAIGISNNSSQFGFLGNDIQTILSAIGIGFYMTVIGTILMLFFKTTKTRL